MGRGPKDRTRISGEGLLIRKRGVQDGGDVRGSPGAGRKMRKQDATIHS